MFRRILTGAALATAMTLGASGQASAALTSNVFGFAVDPLVMSTVSGDAFDLASLDLALGPHNPAGAQSETIFGLFADSHTDSMTFDVGYGFHPRAIGWSGLRSVRFSQMPGDGYLALDNIRYATDAAGAGLVDFEDRTAGEVINTSFKSGGMNFDLYWGVVYGPADPVDFPTGVPEPTTWALLLTGFAGLGLALRRARRLPDAHPA
ncbi:PEPxxWA-CTERM sorting domain-containing protein [Phenylobacterium sp.]|uniref:PEPxxWA-CTERM sorting domain-containing protein n=1 Tax=Phenylobacterium sp. TaxID=1871053 RepID=UPI00286A716A|nr:PEPxxWA-CTERM sorting domain-containing protein [Phenylobacterium sp.]